MGIVAMPGKAISGRVSVIIPVYNRSQMLGQALACIGWQSHHDVEIIVVDDGSDDLCRDSFETQFLPGCRKPTHYIRQDNQGVSAARNAGIRHSSGEYIYFLDSDDLLVPGALEALVAGLTESGRGYCIGRVFATDMPVRTILEEMRQDVSAQVFGSSGWCSHGAIYRRDTVMRAGGFDPALRVGEDTIFQLQIKLAAGAGAAIESLVALRRFHDGAQLNATWQPADQATYLQSLAHLVVRHSAFQAAPRLVRLRFMKELVVRAAMAARAQPSAARAALALMADALLQDLPFANRAVRWMAAGQASWRLTLAAAMLRLVRRPQRRNRDRLRQLLTDDIALLGATRALLRDMDIRC